MRRLNAEPLDKDDPRSPLMPRERRRAAKIDACPACKAAGFRGDVQCECDAVISFVSAGRVRSLTD